MTTPTAAEVERLIADMDEASTNAFVGHLLTKGAAALRALTAAPVEIPREETGVDWVVAQICAECGKDGWPWPNDWHECPLRAMTAAPKSAPVERSELDWAIKECRDIAAAESTDAQDRYWINRLCNIAAPKSAAPSDSAAMAAIELVNKQALDHELWFGDDADYVRQALRQIHAAIEGDFALLAVLASPIAPPTEQKEGK